MTAKDRSSKKGLDGQLAKLVASTNTIKVLTILAERPASPSQIGAALGLSTSAASHHVKKLVGLDMVELVDERDVGGTMQHIYRAIVCPQVGNEEWQKLSLAQRQRFSIWIFQLVLADAASSFDAALFDACPNNHLSRTPMMLDQQGFDEVAEIQDRALAEIFRAEERSRERIASGAGPVINIVAAMTCFELPVAGDGPGAAAIDQIGPTATEWREEVKRMKVHEVPSAVPLVAIRKSR